MLRRCLSSIIKPGLTLMPKVFRLGTLIINTPSIAHKIQRKKSPTAATYFTSCKLAFPHNKTKIVQNTPKQKLTVADFPCMQTNTILMLHINNKGLPFPLAKVAAYKSVWRGSSARAPFLNRREIIMALLKAAYYDFSDIEQKPAYAVQTMNPGSGKTRLLVEWCYHALNDPQIVETFLYGDWDEGTVDDRKVFVNALYKTVFMQRMIIVSSSSLLTFDPQKKQHETIIEMIKDNVFDRFNNKTVTLKNGWSLHITSESLKDDRLASVGTCVDLFNACVDQFCEAPTEYPFDVPNVDRNLLIFGIDECQYYSSKSEGTQTEDLIYTLLREAAVKRFELNNTAAFWMVTGTIVPGSFHDKAASYNLVRGSMENLLHTKYLDIIAKQYLGKSLHKCTIDQTEVNNDDFLHDETAQTLVRLYYRTFGLPRGVEIMIEVAGPYLIKLEAHLAAKESISTSTRQISLLELKQELKRVSAVLEGKFERLFPNATSSALFNKKMAKSTSEVKTRIQHAIELLDIKAALCLQMEIKDKIPDLDCEPQVLEEDAYLLQWTKINEISKKYTRPFLFSYNTVFKPLALLQTTATSEHWKPFEISLSTLILHPNCSVEHSNIKGKCFEYAVAASIYARYMLAANKERRAEVQLSDIFECTNLPEKLHTAQVALNGVVVLTAQLSGTNSAVHQEIAEKQVITIDPKASEFVDVVLPAKMNGHNIFIGFQTKQNQGQVGNIVLIS